MDLPGSFSTTDFRNIWKIVDQHLDVYSVTVAGETAIYDYHWSDHNYMLQQIQALGGT